MAPQKRACYSTGMLFLMFAVVASVIGVCSGSDLEYRRPSLVFYVFEQFEAFAGRNVTNVLAAPPSGNIMEMKWADLGVADMPIRARRNPSAPIIGTSPAFWYRNQKPTSSIYKLITLDTQDYKGTLFAFADSAGFKLKDFDSVAEFGVSGGTGCFRHVTGYIIVSVVSDELDHTTYKYELYLSTCSDSSRFPLQMQLSES